MSFVIQRKGGEKLTLQKMNINGMSLTVPKGAIAFKYTDPTEESRWIFSEEDIKDIRAVDPSLILRVPLRPVKSKPKK